MNSNLQEQEQAMQNMVNGQMYYQNGTTPNRGAGHMQNGGGKMVNEKYKTQRCRHYEAHGQCALGDYCHFAHGDGELRKPNDALNPEQEKLALKSQQY